LRLAVAALERVAHPLGQHGRAGFARGGQGGLNRRALRARPRPILYRHQLRLGGGGVDAVPDRVLPSRATGDEPPRFLRADALGQVLEQRPRIVAGDDDDFAGLGELIEPLPCVTDQGQTANVEKQLIAPAHTAAAPGGDNDNGNTRHKRRSADEVVRNMAVNIGEPHVAAVKEVGHLFVIHPEQV
jgi:hypothetical protein